MGRPYNWKVIPEVEVERQTDGGERKVKLSFNASSFDPTIFHSNKGRLRRYQASTAARNQNQEQRHDNVHNNRTHRRKFKEMNIRKAGFREEKQICISFRMLLGQESAVDMLLLKANRLLLQMSLHSPFRHFFRCSAGNSEFIEL